MRRAMPPGSPDFISTAGKIQVITALENMLKFNDDQEYIDHCKYCIDIVRQGVEFNYYEVLDFIGVTSEPVPAEVSIYYENVRPYFIIFIEIAPCSSGLCRTGMLHKVLRF